MIRLLGVTLASFALMTSTASFANSCTCDEACAEACNSGHSENCTCKCGCAAGEGCHKK